MRSSIFRIKIIKMNIFLICRSIHIMYQVISDLLKSEPSINGQKANTSTLSLDMESTSSIQFSA